MPLLPESWSTIIAPETPLLELVARGSVLYLAVLLLMRVMPRRTGGELALMDLVFVVLIANAAANGLGDYSAVSDGIVLIATLMGWNYLLNVLSYRFRFIEWCVSPPPIPIVRDGRLLRRNMRRELLTEEELMEQLRREGIEDLDDVKAAFVESEGKITAVRRERTVRET